MNIKRILKAHGLWLATNGKEGKKADLRGARLVAIDSDAATISYGNKIMRINFGLED